MSAARLFLFEDTKMRVLAYFLYQLRNVADGLDGVVARATINEKKMVIHPESWGFYIDGICDGIADVAVVIATMLFLLRYSNNFKLSESNFIKNNFPTNSYSHHFSYQMKHGTILLFAHLESSCFTRWAEKSIVRPAHISVSANPQTFAINL